MGIHNVNFPDFSELYSTQDLSADDLRFYATQIANLAFFELFGATEARQMGAAMESVFMDRARLVIIGDKTLHELIQEKYLKENSPGDFQKWYAENRDTLSAQFLAAALITGKHVEAYIPAPSGELPAEPTILKKTGYTPNESTPEILDAWGQFAQVFTDYDNSIHDTSAKATGCAFEGKNLDHHDLMNSAELRANEEKRNLEDARKRLRMQHYVAYMGNKEVISPSTRAILFKPYMTNKKHAHWDVLVNSFNETPGAIARLSRSEPASTCICLLTLIYPTPSIQQIMNPNELHEVKNYAANQYFHQLKSYGASDTDVWLGSIYFHGQRALLSQINTLMKGVDLKNPQSRAKVMPHLRCITSVLHDTNQALNRPDVKEGYLTTAMQTFPGTVEEKKKALEDLRTQADNVVGFINTLFRGDLARIELASPIPDKSGTTTEMHLANLAAERWALDCQAEKAKTRKPFLDTIPSYEVIESLPTFAYQSDTFQSAYANIKMALKDWKACANSILNRDLDNAFFFNDTRKNTSTTSTTSTFSTTSTSGIDVWFSKDFQKTWNLTVANQSSSPVPVTEKQVLDYLNPPPQLATSFVSSGKAKSGFQ